MIFVISITKIGNVIPTRTGKKFEAQSLRFKSIYFSFVLNLVSAFTGNIFNLFPRENIAVKSYSVGWSKNNTHQNRCQQFCRRGDVSGEDKPVEVEVK